MHTTRKAATGRKLLFSYVQLEAMDRRQTEAKQKEDALQPTQGEWLLAHRSQQWGEQLPTQ